MSANTKMRIVEQNLYDKMSIKKKKEKSEKETWEIYVRMRQRFMTDDSK